jgi:cob(I)alamin adenosyltransferase
MKIYTKTGDTGKTSLISGRRISKSNMQIDAYGTVDELNSWIGLLRDMTTNENRILLLNEIQDRLFTIGSLLAADTEKDNKIALPPLYEEDIALLEKAIDDMDAVLPPMRSFVLPGGHQLVSFCHITRTVCRRAERLVVALSEVQAVEQKIITYLNRLSDYLFVLSRKITQELNATEIPWIPRK